MESLITTGGIAPEIAARIEKACNEEFGSEPPIIENIVDTKALENHYKVQKEQELRKEVQELKARLEETPWDNVNDNIVVNVSPDKAKKNNRPNN
ncbi:hypothetical protein IMSAG049_00064 [Clostridiales bacterium]|nr:hypothetical protein IMSAG049_00064 [Clostridiales bacterium]